MITKEEISRLDEVREIILKTPNRLRMVWWHGKDSSEIWSPETLKSTEVDCGTTHCLAGWLQVCSEDPGIRGMPTRIAAQFLLPSIPSKIYYDTEKDVIEWLRDRVYAK